MLKKNTKIALIISSGLGNAVMLVPLLNKLKEGKTNHITIFLDSPFVSDTFLKFNEFPFDELIELTKINKTNYIFNNIRSFDIIYLDYSSSSLKNVLFSSLLSKNTVAFKKNKIPFLNIKYRNEKENTHSTVLNIQLFDKDYKESDFDISQLKLNMKNGFKPDTILNIEKEKKIPVVIQASSANMKAPYKNWPVEKWISLINMISIDFPDLSFILMGDENEISIGKQIEKGLLGSFINLIGKTELTEMCNILYFSKLYIGLDSGLMHLAVAYGIPTFSIFGASSYHFVGYEKFDNKKHKVIYNPINCWPCHGFSKTNTNRLTNPGQCPDFQCINGISPEKVFSAFSDFFSTCNKK
jgi:ADP-heptose:LPS heptosyltransferase